jgi:transcriptional regulator with XRE-family HTH domain
VSGSRILNSSARIKYFKCVFILTKSVFSVNAGFVPIGREPALNEGIRECLFRQRFCLILKFMNETGNRIKQLRKMLGLTQKEIGDTLSCSPSLIGGIERGERLLNRRLSLLLTRAFSVNPDWLNSGSEPVFLTVTFKADEDRDNIEVLSLYNSLTPELKIFVRKLLKNLLEIRS